MVTTENNDEHLANILKQLVEAAGDIEKAIDELVVEQGIPKRIAESLACDLDIIPERYKLNEGTFGCGGQKRLLRSKVLVAGLGGLGGYVVEQLVRCGTGIVIGVDADHFEQTNLNRQLHADLNTIGLRKTEVVKNRVAEINDAVEFNPFACRVEDLEDAAYEGVAVIFDCLDMIPSKLHLQDMGKRFAIPLVHGAIGGWYGQVATVWPGSQILSRIYGERQEGIERDLGNPPFTPAFVATLMVAEGIKLLMGKENREDRILFIDLLNGQWEYVMF